MGIMNLAATTAPASKGGGSSLYLLVLVALFVGFYFLMIRPQRNRQRRTMQAQNQVSPGKRIRTTAGMYGTIVSSDDRDIVVEVAPGVQVKMLRRAIMEVLPDDDGGDGYVADQPGPEDEAAFEDHPFDHDHDHEDEPAAGPASEEFNPSLDHEEQPNGSTSRDEREIKDRNV
jgi:preprotein translocase subunit YajC